MSDHENYSFDEGDSEPHTGLSLSTDEGSSADSNRSSQHQELFCHASQVRAVLRGSATAQAVQDLSVSQQELYPDTVQLTIWLWQIWTQTAEPQTTQAAKLATAASQVRRLLQWASQAQAVNRIETVFYAWCTSFRLFLVLCLG